MMSDKSAPDAKGTLATHPLPRLIFHLHTQSFTGVVELDQGEERPLIFFRDGGPTGTTLRSSADVLGRILLERGWISEGAYLKSLETLAEAQQSKTRISQVWRLQGEILLNQGEISDPELVEGLRLQLGRKLNRLFGLFDGAFAIFAGEHHFAAHPEREESDIDPLALIHQGVRNHYTEERMSAELGKLAAKHLGLERGADQIWPRFNFGSEELRLVEWLAMEPRPFDAIIARSAGARLQTEMLLYTLWITELLAIAGDDQTKAPKPGGHTAKKSIERMLALYVDEAPAMPAAIELPGELDVEGRTVAADTLRRSDPTRSPEPPEAPASSPKTSASSPETPASAPDASPSAKAGAPPAATPPAATPPGDLDDLLALYCAGGDPGEAPASGDVDRREEMGPVERTADLAPEMEARTPPDEAALEPGPPLAALNVAAAPPPPADGGNSAEGASDDVLADDLAGDEPLDAGDGEAQAPEDDDEPEAPTGKSIELLKSNISSMLSAVEAIASSEHQTVPAAEKEPAAQASSPQRARPASADAAPRAKEAAVKRSGSAVAATPAGAAKAAARGVGVPQPELDESNFAKGFALFRRRDYPGAREAFAQAVAATSDHGAPLAWSVWTDFCDPEISRADREAQLTTWRDQLTEATQRSPSSADCHYFLGEIQKALKETDAALACFDRALEIDADHLEAARQRRLIRRRRGEKESSAGLFGRLFKRKR